MREQASTVETLREAAEILRQPTAWSRQTRDRQRNLADRLDAIADAMVHEPTPDTDKDTQ
jgi:hypothetical protein